MIITNVMAVSLDGRIASQPGETDVARRALGFTNDDDRAHLLELIQEADAVIVGRASLEASGGAFELPNSKGVQPIWVVMTNGGFAPDSRFLKQEKLPRWLVSRAPLPALPTQPSLRNLTYGDASAAATAVRALAAAGAERVLLFGGAEVNRLFYNEGLVDELILTLCPLILAQGHAVPLVAPGLPRPIHLSLVTSHPKSNLVFLKYKVLKN